MHEVLVNRLGGLSLTRKSVVWLTDRPDMTVDVCCVRKTTTQQQHDTCDNLISIDEIVVHLPERTETGRLTVSYRTKLYGPCVAAKFGYEF